MERQLLKKAVLVDGGVGKYYHKVIKNYLTLNNVTVTKLTAIVVSHYDSDHLNGITKLIENKNSVLCQGNVFIYDIGVMIAND